MDGGQRTVCILQGGLVAPIPGAYTPLVAHSFPSYAPSTRQAAQCASWPFFNSAGPSAKVLATLDQYDLLRLEAERALREKKRREQEQGAQEGQGAQKEGSLGREEGREAAPVQGREGLDAEGRREVAAGRGERGREGSVGPGGGGEGEAVAGGAAAAAAAGKRRNDEGAVQSARERYLARKMQKTG